MAIEKRVDSRRRCIVCNVYIEIDCIDRSAGEYRPSIRPRTSLDSPPPDPLVQIEPNRSIDFQLTTSNTILGRKGLQKNKAVKLKFSYWTIFTKPRFEWSPATIGGRQLVADNWPNNANAPSERGFQWRFRSDSVQLVLNRSSKLEHSTLPECPVETMGRSATITSIQRFTRFLFTWFLSPSTHISNVRH